MNTEFRTTPHALKKFDFVGPFLIGCVLAIILTIALLVALSLVGIDPERNSIAMVMVVLVALSTPIVVCIRHLLYWTGVQRSERCILTNEGVDYYTPFNTRIFMRWEEITEVRLEDGDHNEGPDLGNKLNVVSTKNRFTINDSHFGSDAYYELRTMITLKSPSAAKIQKR